MAGNKGPSKFSQKVDQISRAIFLDENGKPKSAFLLYAFCLSLLFEILYGIAYLTMSGVIDSLFETAPHWLRNGLEFAVPAIVGTLPCIGIFYLTKKQRSLVPTAFLWMLGLLILVLVSMIFIVEDAEEYGIFMYILGIPFILSTLVGGTSSWLLYRNYLKNHPLPTDRASLPGYKR